MTFIFASLVELAIIGYMSRNKDEKRNPEDLKSNELDWTELNELTAPMHHSDDEENPTIKRAKYHLNGWSFQQYAKSAKRHCTAEAIDSVSAVLFPVLFALFNVFYWARYHH